MTAGGGNGLQPGDWALVTGASEGIGRELCCQLAVRGVNLVMVARGSERLHELASELYDVHRVACQPVAIDLAKQGSPALVREAVEENGIAIRLLCNNAATGYRGRFETQDLEACERTIRLNAHTVVELCALFLPDLLEHRRSFIINVTSQAAINPMPFMAVYGATKAFVHSFSQALYGELAERGVVVQTLVPSPTFTAFDVRAGTDDVLGVVRRPVEEVVRLALDKLESGAPLVSNARHLIRQRLFSALAPPRMVIRTVARMFRPRGE